MKNKSFSFKTLLHYPLMLFFFAFVLIFSIIDFAKKDKVFSQLENRNLTKAPTFTVASFLGNEWTGEYGEYTKDQFLFRDNWISLQSIFESGQGKLENGGIWFAQDNYLIAKNSFFAPNSAKLLQVNTDAVSQLSQRFPGKVSAMIVPSPANTLSGLLRYSPPQINEDAIINDIYSAWQQNKINTIDLRKPFAGAQAENKQIYYKTDHHWTTDGGALLAYNAFCTANKLQPLLPPADKLKTVAGFKGTNFSKSKKFGTKADEIAYWDIETTMEISKLENDGSISKSKAGLMEKEKFKTLGKYDAFLNGNNGYSEIKGTGKGSVLLIKDSYGNCFAPYLLQNYAKVGVMDLRAWHDVDAVIKNEAYDDILVLYSFDNFSYDANIKRMMTK